MYELLKADKRGGVDNKNLQYAWRFYVMHIKAPCNLKGLDSDIKENI